MVLLRRVIGDALRARRQAQHRTLREVSTAANVSLGYLSEIERGQKEASSELLASVCEALGAALSEVLRDVSDTLALAEDLPPVLVPVGAGGDGAAQESGSREAVPASSGAAPAAAESAAEPTASLAKVPAVELPAKITSAARVPMTPVAAAQLGAEPKIAIAEAKLSLSVMHDGPLKTTLRATRSTREREIVGVG